MVACCPPSVNDAHQQRLLPRMLPVRWLLALMAVASMALVCATSRTPQYFDNLVVASPNNHMGFGSAVAGNARYLAVGSPSLSPSGVSINWSDGMVDVMVDVMIDVMVVVMVDVMVDVMRRDVMGCGVMSSCVRALVCNHCNNIACC